MEKRYYNAATLKNTVAAYEAEYGMASDEFYAAHLADDPSLGDMPRHQRSLWASLWREHQELVAVGHADANHSGQLHPALLVG